MNAFEHERLEVFVWRSIPKKYCRCSQESVDLTLQLNWRYQKLERFVTWKGKRILARSWFNVCEKETWMKHLLGRMPQPLLKPAFFDLVNGEASMVARRIKENWERQIQAVGNAGIPIVAGFAHSVLSDRLNRN